MGIKIDIQNVKMSGKSEILNNAQIKAGQDLDLKIKDIEASDDTKLLNDFQMNDMVDELGQILQKMDRLDPEYAALEKLLNHNNTADKKTFLAKVKQHLRMFSDGVLQNVVADIISGKIM